MTDNLKPCPFCNSTHIYIESSDNPLIPWYVVGCLCCKAGTYAYEDRDEAIGAWNMRTEKTCSPDPIYENIFQCDKCGEMMIDRKYPNYCPGCGAKVVD